MDRPDYQFAVVVALLEEASYFKDLVRCGEPFGLGEYTAWEIVDFHWTHLGPGLLVCSGEMGGRKARSTVEHILAKTRVQLLFNLGIAGRIDKELAVGSVVVPKIVYDAREGGKISQGGGKDHYTFSPTPRYVHGPLMGRARAHFAPNSPVLPQLNSRLNQHFEHHPLLPSKGLTIVEAPIACVHSVSQSAVFSESLTRPDRKMAALDMESGGFLEGAEGHEVQTLCVRAISDYADENKRLIEDESAKANRRIAMAYATEACEVIVGSLPTKEVNIAGPDPLAVDGFLFVATQEHANEERLVRTEFYDDYFSLLVHDDDGERIAHPISHLSEVLHAQSTQSPVFLVGDKGVGKTTFLKHLHIRLVASPDTRPATSFLVRLKKAETWRNGEYDAEETKARISSACDKILGICGEVSSSSVFVILDGFNMTGEYRLDLAKLALSRLQDAPNLRILVSVESQADLVLIVGLSNLEASFSAYITSMPSDDADFPELVRRFSQVESLPIAERVVEDIRTKGVIWVDTFILVLFFKQFQKRIFRPFKHLSEYYNLFCQRHLADMRQREQLVGERQLADVAKDAFDIVIARTKRFQDITKRDVASLISAHSSVINFLVAYHVVEVLVRRSSKSQYRQVSGQARKDKENARRTLNYVFPSEVNSFIKQMMAADGRTESAIIDFIIRNFRNLDTLSKSHCAYLAGRVSSGRAEEMKAFLRVAYLTNFPEDSLAVDGDVGDERRDRRMFRRGILISLASLGDMDAEEKYATILLDDLEENEFNRGFHLEYYGDTDFDPESKMSRRDDKDAPCDRTFARLMDRIYRPGLARVPLIELVTIASLAQSRNCRNTLKDEQRREVISLLGSSRVRDASLSPKIRGYVGRMIEDLSAESFSLAGALQDWESLALIERTGWLRRRRDAELDTVQFWRTRRIESVAEHTFLAMGLATMFLRAVPSSSECYSKDRVIRMLLVHDLGEGRLGDQLPGINNSEEEARVLWEYGAFATYRGMGDLWEVPELFQEFTQGATIDARVAQDLDRLQFILQARTYGEGMSADERKKCEGMRAYLTTATVRTIEEMLRDHPAVLRFALPIPPL